MEGMIVDTLEVAHLVEIGSSCSLLRVNFLQFYKVKHWFKIFFFLHVFVVGFPVWTWGPLKKVKITKTLSILLKQWIMCRSNYGLGQSYTNRRLRHPEQAWFFLGSQIQQLNIPHIESFAASPPQWEGNCAYVVGCFSPF